MPRRVGLAALHSRGPVTPMMAEPTDAAIEAVAKPNKKAKAKSKGAKKVAGTGKGKGDGGVFPEVPDPGSSSSSKQQRQPATAVDIMIAAGLPLWHPLVALAFC